MIYNVKNTSGIGKPCRVFDAHGTEIVYVLKCDTETGVVERIVYTNGKFELSESGDLKRITERRAAPLRVQWAEEDPPL